MTDQEALIREAVTAEADEAVDHRAVLAALRTRRARRRPLALLAVGALTAVAAVVAVAVPLVVDRGSPPAATEVPPPTGRTVLLVGLDDVPRPDAVVVARISPDGAVSTLSLPRDTLVDLPDVGPGRLGDAYARAYQAAGTAGQDAHLAGAEALARAVSHLTGVRVDHHAAVRMSAFAELSDALGGVEVCLRAPAVDPASGVDLPAGRNTLRGADALAFLRQRRGLPKGDVDRAVRHQAFLTGALSRAAELAADPAALAGVAAVVRRTVLTDPGWDPMEVAGLLRPAGAVRGAVIPVLDPTEVGQDGLDPGLVRPVSPEAVRAFATSHLADPAPDSPPPPTAGPDNCVG
ncbi:LCP family protein [Saccharothrix xinjiangensis]|uniref:LCP family protein n=1 Tax=Saccharothrix xinjiangensis TaxID=204798 RepID=A0ABV9XT17_9PSEU